MKILSVRFVWVAALLSLSFVTGAGAAPAKKAAPTTEVAPAEAPARRQRQYSLTDDQLRILERGEIGEGAYVAGGIVGTVFGLGIGHAIQGRYSNKGWIFTVGELASYTLLVSGATSCIDEAFESRSCDSGLIAAGVVGLVGFRIWEIIDIWVGGFEHNQTYRRLKAREKEEGFSFYILPLPRQSVAGLQFRF